MSAAFPAKYSGRCGYDDPIQPGDIVEFDVDGELVHTACKDNPPPNPDAPRRTERQCSECFTIHAGECL